MQIDPDAPPFVVLDETDDPTDNMPILLEEVEVEDSIGREG